MKVEYQIKKYSTSNFLCNLLKRARMGS